MMKRILFYSIVCIICVACKKEDAQPAFDWSTYYPLQVGTTRTYECTSIHIDLATGIRDTSVFQIKEIVKNCFVDTNSCKVYAINTMQRSNESEDWTAYNSQSVQLYNNQIVRVEDNVPLEVLRFPANTQYMWNLNEYNTNDEQQVFYSSVNVSDEVAGVSYDSVLVVTQQDFKSLYTYQFAEERYAKNVGLIYRQNIDVESQPNQANIDLTKPIEERITKGTIVTYQLIDASLK